MRTFKRRACAFSFSEADKSWDSTIDSGRCPKCSEPLYDFPVPVKGQRQGALGVLENKETMGEQNIVAKVSEEDMYAAALAELQSGTTRPGLWAKAFADSEGDENKSKALYIKLRVQQEIERIQQDQKAADALAAEPARRKAAEFTAAIEQLRLKGYNVKKTGSGWAVREPLGGRVKHNSDQSLLEYAQRHVDINTELLDSFSPNSAKLADEKSDRPGRPSVGTAAAPKIRYVYAIAACFALFVLKMSIDGMLGWKHGGGAIPMLIFFAALFGTWRAITKKGDGK